MDNVGRKHEINYLLNRYHSEATLRTMKPFRIGRKQGPWVNHTPPIRGGVFYKVTAPVAPSSTTSSESCPSDSEDNVDDVISQVSSHTSYSVDHADNESDDSGMRQRLGKSLGADLKEPVGPVSRPSATLRVANAAIARETEKDLATYPSLDPIVQAEIARKYQILHQRVYDDGLYECPYLDYGKEMIRYSLLFTGFVVALRYEWYMTSAVCLGLFWVCPLHR